MAKHLFFQCIVTLLSIFYYIFLFEDNKNLKFCNGSNYCIKKTFLGHFNNKYFAFYENLKTQYYFRSLMLSFSQLTLLG